MAKNKATIIAFLTAPFVSASIGIATSDFFGPLDLSRFIVWLLIFYWFSFLATALFGLPIFIIFRRYNIIYWWSALGAGIVIGALVAVIFVFPNTLQIGGLIAMSSMGGASGFAFWLIRSFGSK